MDDRDDVAENGRALGVNAGGLLIQEERKTELDKLKHDINGSRLNDIMMRASNIYGQRMTLL